MTEQLDQSYDAQEKDPVLYNLGIEHLRSCRACVQTSGAHHVGVGSPLEQVQQVQLAEISETTFTQVSKTLNALQGVVEDIKEWVDILKDPKSTIPVWIKAGSVGGAILGFIVGLITGNA